MDYTILQLKNAVERKGYKFFENGDYNLNIIGIRNSATGDQITNKFDDLMTLSFKVDGKWYLRKYECTTDPGSHWTKNLLNEAGVAILVPGQYRGSHMVGLHQGKYEALRQKAPLKVYRDKDKDSEYDLIQENIREGIYGINIHRASKWGTSKQIDKWSAGCQVIANNENFAEFMRIVNSSKEKWGNSFTYTLLDSKDI